MKKHFNETKIPETTAYKLDQDRGLIVAANHIEKNAEVLVLGTAKALLSIKSETQPAAFVFETLSGEMIMAAVIEWEPKQEGSNTTGNWQHSWTFERDDIPENARVIRITDSLTHSFFVDVAGTKYKMRYEQPDWMEVIMIEVAQSIKSCLDENATTAEVFELELPSIFMAKSKKTSKGVIEKSFEFGEVAKEILKGTGEAQ